MSTLSPVRKIGLRVSLYDDHDNEMKAASAWIDHSDDNATIRALYDELAAALWPALNDALDALRHAAEAPSSTP